MRKCLRTACFTMLTALALPANAKTGHFVLNFDCTKVPYNRVYKIYNYIKKEAYMGGMTYGLTTTGSMPTYIDGSSDKGPGFDGVQFGMYNYTFNDDWDGIYFNLPFAGMNNLTLTMKGRYKGGQFVAGYTNDGGKNITRFYYSANTQDPTKDPLELTPVDSTLTNYTFRTAGFNPVNGNLMFKMRSSQEGFYFRLQKIDLTCEVAEVPECHYTAVSSTYPINYAASGLSAYKVTVKKDGKVWLTPVLGLAAANSVVLVNGRQTASYPLVTTNSTTETGTDVTSDIKISDGNVTGDGQTIFALGQNENGNVGFIRVKNGTNVSKGTGYVKVENENDNFIPLNIGQSLSIDDNQYCTLYDGTNNLTVPTGATAYTYKVAGNKLLISKTYAEGSVIPQGTGVVVKAAKGTYDFPISNENGERDDYNMLRGSDTNAETTGGGLYYMLSLNDQKDERTIGFYWGADNGDPFICTAHKAYLVVPSSTAAKGWTLEPSATTGISTLTTATKNSPNATYNLAGQRVDSNYRGVVIRGGKKYINR